MIMQLLNKMLKALFTNQKKLLGQARNNVKRLCKSSLPYAKKESSMSSCRHDLNAIEKNFIYIRNVLADKKVKNIKNYDPENIDKFKQCTLQCLKEIEFDKKRLKEL